MKLRQWQISLFLLICFAVFTWYNTWSGSENSLQDRFYQTEQEIDTRIIVIGIDDESLGALGRWPWPRSVHAQLLQQIAAGNPAAVGFDVMFSEATNPPDDAAFAAAVQTLPQLVLPVYGEFERVAGVGQLQAVGLTTPYPPFMAGVDLGHINTFPDDNGVVRLTALQVGYQGTSYPSFAWQLYAKYLERQGEAVAAVPVDSWGRMHIDYSGVPGAFAPLSYLQVLNGDVPPEYFTDAIVLIGPYALGIGDYYFTPLASHDPMFGVEIHANILQNLLNGHYKQPAADWLRLLLLVVVAAVAHLLFTRLKPGWGALCMLLLAAGYLYAARQVYRSGTILPIFYPLALLVVSYAVTLAYRYLAEMLERRRVTDVFGRYVAPQVVDTILRQGEAGLALGGIRRDLTALFVDIRGFTPLSERARPEEVVEILNSYLNLCAHAIFEVGGTLDKFIGDAAMALFNAPLDLDDHAFQAVKAAWAMKQGSRSLQEDLERRFGRTVQFGVGINSGDAVVGNIGADFRMDYTAIGDTINTAARLESNAKPGQILLSKETYERVKEKVEVSYLGEIKVKGKEQGVPIYQLEGVKLDAQ